MNCIGFHEDKSADQNGSLRKIIVFELRPVYVGPEVSFVEGVERIAKEIPLEELFVRAREHASKSSSPKERKINYYQRCEFVRIYALRKANGKCQGCGREAPFLNKNKEPFLEVHHLLRLSDGGPDDPSWVIALCPNCHSRIHNGIDGEKYNEELKERVVSAR